MDEAKAKAEKLLVHYLRTAWVTAGLNWNSDNDAEVGIIVDRIGDMVRAGVAEHTDTAVHLVDQAQLFPAEPVTEGEPPAYARVPLHRLDIAGLTDQVDDPTEAVQYRAVDEGGRGYLYGDQQWVADGRVLYHHPGGHVEQRPVTITYGPWTRVSGGSSDG